MEGRYVRSIFADCIKAGNIGSGSQTIVENEIPANLFKQDGDKLKIKHSISLADNNGTKKFWVYLGNNWHYYSGDLTQQDRELILETTIIRVSDGTLRYSSFLEGNKSEVYSKVQNYDAGGFDLENALDFKVDVNSDSDDDNSIVFNFVEATFIPFS